MGQKGLIPTNIENALQYLTVDKLVTIYKSFRIFKKPIEFSDFRLYL